MPYRRYDRVRTPSIGNSTAPHDEAGTHLPMKYPNPFGSFRYQYRHAVMRATLLGDDTVSPSCKNSLCPLRESYTVALCIKTSRMENEVSWTFSACKLVPCAEPVSPRDNQPRQLAQGIPACGSLGFAGDRQYFAFRISRIVCCCGRISQRFRATGEVDRHDQCDCVIRRRQMATDVFPARFKRRLGSQFARFWILLFRLLR